jgi:hypothetical protein
MAQAGVPHVADGRQNSHATGCFYRCPVRLRTGKLTVFPVIWQNMHAAGCRYRCPIHSWTGKLTVLLTV